jgi:hypothetical protein
LSESILDPIGFSIIDHLLKVFNWVDRSNLFDGVIWFILTALEPFGLSLCERYFFFFNDILFDSLLLLLDDVSPVNSLLLSFVLLLVFDKFESIVEFLQLLLSFLLDLIVWLEIFANGLV